MNDAYYIKNLNQFIKSLPDSSVRFLYFSWNSSTKEWAADMNETSKLWIDPKAYPDPLYITSGVRGENYCYIYRESDILYDTHLNELGHVDSFIANSDFTSVPASATSKGGNVVQTNWGDHITVGIERVNMKLFLRTHKISYVLDKLNKYSPRRMYCDVVFNSKIHEKTTCYNDGYLLGYSLEWYKKVGNDPHALSIIQALLEHVFHSSINGGEKKASSSYIIYQQKRYKIRQGPKGGIFINIAGRKKYLSKGGDGNQNSMYKKDGFSEKFTFFIQQYIIEPIHTPIEKTLVNVEYIDDDGSDQVMIRFIEDFGDFGNKVEKYSIFAMKKESILEAFHIYTIPHEKRTIQQQQTLDNFRHHTKTSVRISVQ